MSRTPNVEALKAAREALRANRELSKLYVCPGPRGAPVSMSGRPRRLGKHLYWYIGEFQVRPGVAGPVPCEEAPRFRTESAARGFLASVLVDD